MQDCIICQPAAFWRKSVAEKIGPFDEQLNFVMDYDYWIRITKSGAEICFMPEKLAYSRLYPETKTLSGRSKIYEEIFEISRKHVGYVHRSYYQGHWQQKLYENEQVSPAIRLIRHIPGAHLPIGWLHCRWARRKSYTWQYVIAFFRKQVLSLLSKLGIKTTISQTKAWFKSFSGGKMAVAGLFSDNWIADKLIIAPKKYADGQTLYIAGTSLENTTAKVYARGKLIKKQEILANTYTKVEFPSESIDNKVVIIKFTKFSSDSARRRLGLLLQDTNIFTEQDTW
jgi:hypothetical protein